MARSKTGAAAIATGVLGSMTPINEALQAARSAGDNVAGLMAAGPWIVAAIVIISAAGFIWWDRSRKLKEDGV
jgi:hypothetical protein